MTSYNSIDGIPCTSNKYLLTDVLRDQWGFKGFVYSDLTSIEGIVGARVAKDNKEAAVLALKAGLDMTWEEMLMERIFRKPWKKVPSPWMTSTERSLMSSV